MHSLTTTEFICQLRATTSLSEMQREMARITRELGFGYFLLAERDPSMLFLRRIILTNIPKQSFHHLDNGSAVAPQPISKLPYTDVEPYWWGPKQTIEGHITCDYLDVDEYTDLPHGIVVPIFQPGAPMAICVFAATESQILPVEHETAAISIAHRTFPHAQKLVAISEAPDSLCLSDLQHKVLLHIANGRSSATIAQLLHRPPMEIHSTIRSLRHRFRCTTNLEVVVRALHEGSIHYQDVLR